MHPYQNPELPINGRLDDLLARMTLAEKIGQMTQVEKNSISPEEVTTHAIGSILSGGGGNPRPNNPVNWRNMVEQFQHAALKSRLGIPMIYGVDAVHGHSNMVEATIFPHNIGIGGSGDADLVQRIAEVTAKELLATGVRWNFAPAVSCPQDIRWGRTYEGYSQNTAVITQLAVAYLKGLRHTDPHQTILPSVKHFVADGAAKWGTSTRIDWEAMTQIAEDATLANAYIENGLMELRDLGAWKIDQGISDIDEETLRRVHLPPYVAAIEAGAQNIIVSYSTWNGLRMHAQHYMLTEVLKTELGFDGFLVSDWAAIDQIDPDFETCVIQSINAGLDMIMVPFKYQRFIDTLTAVVEQGHVPLSRIDDAVRRILRVKLELGLFEQPFTDMPLSVVGSAKHRDVAREAVRKTALLLKNDNDLLPLTQPLPRLLIGGKAAHDIGYQCGGWTIEWMGRPGPITLGTTLLEGIQALADEETAVVYNPQGIFDEKAPVGIVVIAEEPYAEGMGDRADLHLTADQISLIERMRKQCDRLLLILFSGRPLILTDQLPLVDAFIAAWLPGTEGDGIAELLFGHYPFTARLEYAWPRTMDQVPLTPESDEIGLFMPGDGLTTA